MSRPVLIDGVECADPTHAVAIGDRGLNYGDGLFETILVKQSSARLLESHLERLALGCERLGIAYPGDALLHEEVARLCSGVGDAVLKIVITRGVGGRGYRPADESRPTRILSLHELPGPGSSEIRVRWCETRLAHHSTLAGIKHLNRLEQVLAQREWHDRHIEEGLMLDWEGELVCGTASNVFIVRGAELATPDLRYCGIRGVMRAQVIRAAERLGVIVTEEPLWPTDLESASEVFVTNAIRGIRSVVALENLQWRRGEVTEALQRALST